LSWACKDKAVARDGALNKGWGGRVRAGSLGGGAPSLRSIVLVMASPGPSSGCGVRATPEGTPALTPVHLTALFGGLGWGDPELDGTASLLGGALMSAGLGDLSIVGCGLSLLTDVVEGLRCPDG
jgi:hypothetical protein